MTRLELTSSAFDDGGRIPEKYGYDRDNVNPPLSVAGIPDNTESLAFVVDDPDAKEEPGETFDHWVVWNVPAAKTHIPEGWSPADDGATEGQNGFGEAGYGGPRPPDGEHTSRFRLVALDAELDLDSSATATDLEDAMAEHVLTETQLDGAFTPL